MKIAVVAPQVPKNIKNIIDVNQYLIYACDKAVEELLKQKIAIDLAIGDFDSLNDLNLLKGLKIIKLDKIKDYSDTSFAVSHAFKQTDDVILIGGIKGPRSDHLIANLTLLNEYPNLVIKDNTNKFYRLNEGIHRINKLEYKYFSIFPITKVKVSISGTKYELLNKDLDAFDPLGLSNEIIKDEAHLKLHQGVLLVVQSK